ncbi:MAG: site-specific DNA-methyltransferase [Planctomycetota bacterium]
MSTRILVGDCRLTLPTLPERSVRCCVTSPPYWGLRDYGHGEQIGLEQTPDAYVAELVAVFREVRRVLTDDGTLWLNLGDSYSSMRDSKATPDTLRGDSDGTAVAGAMNRNPAALRAAGLKHKDLVGIPWMLAFALRADGWYLRSDIIWHKPNPMPESVTDRPTKSHEYLFLLAKSERYYYDAAAIAEPLTESSIERLSQPTLDTQVGSDRVPGKTNGNMKAVAKRSGNLERVYGQNPSSPHRASGVPWEGTTRNKRTVWTVATQPFKGAHFATFPPALIEPCILAGSAKGDTILDPFGGAGTTALVADRLGRDAILCELNPTYAELAEQRVTSDSPLFSEVIR